MAHIILLGDSIFDNLSYTGGGPDVITQVRQLLPEGSQASLLAVDGATVKDVMPQLGLMPRDATHLVMSAGGNDALMSAQILDMPVASTAHALEAMAGISLDFEEEYRRIVTACRQLHLPLTICTIYNGCFPEADYQRLISTALMVFNDVILRVGIEFGLTMIDLRLVCSSPEDYANPIEPSSIGGAKIARSIVSVTMAGETLGARVVSV